MKKTLIWTLSEESILNRGLENFQIWQIEEDEYETKYDVFNSYSELLNYLKGYFNNKQEAQDVLDRIFIENEKGEKLMNDLKKYYNIK